MSGDRIGKTFSQAKVINLASGKQNIGDRLSGTNKNDFFRFVLGNRSSISLSLSKLKANANLQLLSDRGQVVLQPSSKSNTNDKTITAVLNQGTYHIRVFSGGKGKSGQSVRTPYRLQATVEPTAFVPLASSSPEAIPTAIALQAAGSFHIQFDYRFDTQGWFTPTRRASLESAARIWESIIADEFPDTPVGTATPYVLNPETDEYVGSNNIFTTDTPIDDVTIFVGARTLGGSTLAVGSPSGNYNNEARYNGSDFEPWLGSISFDNSTNWFFDPTPNTATDIPLSQSDFISTAVHEIGHILGFNRSANAFNNFVVNDAFMGANTLAVNGGNPLPLQPGGAHIREGYEFGGSGETLMDPTSSSGGRQLPTMLDAAILDDVGYTINYSAVYRNQSSNARTAAAITYGRCGCLACMASTQVNVIGSSDLSRLVNPTNPVT
jgi:Bacterial pre-peptidase C-terminal domain